LAKIDPVGKKAARAAPAAQMLERFPIAWTHAIDQKSAQIHKLEHFQAKWIPVRVEKMQQNKGLELRRTRGRRANTFRLARERNGGNAGKPAGTAARNNKPSSIIQGGSTPLAGSCPKGRRNADE